MIIQIRDDQRWDQPILYVGGAGGGVEGGTRAPFGAFAQGIGLLDLSEVEFTPGDWTHVEIAFSVLLRGRWAGYIPALRASVSVYPLTFDVGDVPNAPTDVGWGIDNAWVRAIEADGDNARVDVSATLALKTSAVEMLRVGWLVIVGDEALAQ